MRAQAGGEIGVVRGSALYVGALIGPGLLLIPSLGVRAAGPASVIAWIGLLVISAPVAATFAALAVRYPVAGGVAAYVQAGLGDAAAAVTGSWFVAATLLGAPAVAMMGGYYVADLTGASYATATGVATVIFASVLASNALGLKVSSSVQLVLSFVLVVVLAIALAMALPQVGGDNWTPFAPHGWLAIGTAANILIWLFIGWEAVAQLAGEFRRPQAELPRAMFVAFGIIAILYAALAVATVGIGDPRSQVPLANLVAVGFGGTGRTVTAVLAVALTMGTMNVYLGGVAKLAAALAQTGGLPAWLGRGSKRSVPLRPLVVIAVFGAAMLGGLAAHLITVTDLIRATSSLFVGVYVLAIASAVRILRGRERGVALAAVLMVALIALFSEWYGLVPLAVAGLALLQWAGYRWRSTTTAKAPMAASTADSWRRP